MTSIVVCLGSQFQYAPQLNLAHIIPVTVPNIVNIKPILIAEEAIISFS